MPYTTLPLVRPWSQTSCFQPVGSTMALCSSPAVHSIPTTQGEQLGSGSVSKGSMPPAKPAGRAEQQHYPSEQRQDEVAQWWSKGQLSSAKTSSFVRCSPAPSLWPPASSSLPHTCLCFSHFCESSSFFSPRRDLHTA